MKYQVSYLPIFSTQKVHMPLLSDSTNVTVLMQFVENEEGNFVQVVW